jgi:Flp pilus assembly protein TadG
MLSITNQRGSVVVFITLMIVLLLIMVGMGLDTGQLAYVRSQGQPAVDAAALAAASALPSGIDATVQARATAFNAKNDYLASSKTQLLQNDSVTFINYDKSTTPPTITKVANAAAANGVRVAMENTNPYAGTTTGAMNSPVFLTPLFKLFGGSAPGTQPVSVSATAIIEGIPAIPVAIGGCPPPNSCTSVNGDTATGCNLFQSNSNVDNSGWTTFTIGSANSNLIRDLIDNNSTCGFTPPVSIGTCINMQNGQDTAALQELEQVYLPSTGSPPNGGCGLIPVIDTTVGFNQCSPVRSWAKLCITEINSSGSPKTIKGNLTCNVSNIGPTATSCYIPKLVRDTNSGM